MSPERLAIEVLKQQRNAALDALADALVDAQMLREQLAALQPPENPDEQVQPG